MVQNLYLLLELLQVLFCIICLFMTAQPAHYKFSPDDSLVYLPECVDELITVQACHNRSVLTIRSSIFLSV